MFLSNSTIKTEKITSEIPTLKNADVTSDISSSKLSITQEQERIMINFEFGKSVPKISKTMDIIKNTEDKLDCKFIIEFILSKKYS